MLAKKSAGLRINLLPPTPRQRRFWRILDTLLQGPIVIYRLVVELPLFLVGMYFGIGPFKDYHHDNEIGLIDDSPGCGEFQYIGTEGKPILLHESNVLLTSVFVGYETESEGEVKERIEQYRPSFPSSDLLVLEDEDEANELIKLRRDVFLADKVEKQPNIDRYQQVKAWLEAGANVNATVWNMDYPMDEYKAGYTVLMVAAMHDQKKIVSLLLKHGADVNIKSHRGDTALSIARSEASWGMRFILWRAGAKQAGK
jgi:hypothetical protein